MNTKIKNKNGKIFYYEEYDDYETIPEMVDKNKNNIEYLKAAGGGGTGEATFRSGEKIFNVDYLGTQNETAITELENDITELENDIATNKNGIDTNTLDIISNTNDIGNIRNDIATKQNKLIAGTNIKIVGDTISATGGGAGGVWEVIGATTHTSNGIKFSESLYLFSKISIVGQVKLVSNPYQLYVNFSEVYVDDLKAEKTILLCSTESMWIIGFGELVMWDDLLSFKFFNLKTNVEEIINIEGITKLTVKGIRK